MINCVVLETLERSASALVGKFNNGQSSTEFL